MKLTSKTLTIQAREAIQDMIESSLEVMTKLPSEHELSDKLGVSRNTIREALKILENEGIVSTRHGVGTFVIRSANNIISNITILDSFTKILTNHGYEPGSKSIFFDTRPATRELSKKLGISEGDMVLYIERIRTADGEPVIYVEDYIPIIDDMYERFNLGNTQSLFEFLSYYDIKIAFADCEIKAAISNDKLMECLNLEEPAALLHLKQVHYSNKGFPALYSDSYFISDKFDFSLIRKVMD